MIRILVLTLSLTSFSLKIIADQRGYQILTLDVFNIKIGERYSKFKTGFKAKELPI